MEVVEECSALLSNYEVYKILKETREDQKKLKNNFAKANLRNLNTIAYETLKYFDTICPCSFSSDDVIPNFISEAKQFNLSKTELLQLVNLKPTTHVELHAVIEECEERYTENQIAMLLEVILRNLHSHTRTRTTDSVSSYVSVNDESEVSAPANLPKSSYVSVNDESEVSAPANLPNPHISYEVEVSECQVVEELPSAEDSGKRKMKQAEGGSGLHDPDEDEVISNARRATSALLLSDDEDEVFDDTKKVSQLSENSKAGVKIKINKHSRKTKNKKLNKKSKKSPKLKRVSISDEVNVSQLF